MLFNSPIFIFIFLPITLFIYFALNKYKLVTIAKIFLITASIYFYSYWNTKYVPIIIGSIIINFAIGNTLSNWNEREKRALKTKISKNIILIFGIILNLVILCYYKYCDFFIDNINLIFRTNIPLLHIALPLAISFFTFQQISYIVDSYKNQTKEYDFLNYTLFVTFFPQLIAGPIVRHNDMMPQFEKVKTKIFNWKSFCEGLFLFVIGLSKKVIIADNIAVWANNGYANFAHLTCLEAWITILSYTFQIYYDFSGYTDMALGIGKMFNINLPQNFKNPYNSISIENFWEKWHITLSKFLKDYVYIPLGGNRTFLGFKKEYSAYINILITFFISGLWHGASWMFVIWGILHGIGNCLNKFMKKHSINLFKPICWILTFTYINVTWIFFRSKDLKTAKSILNSALGANGVYPEHIKALPIIILSLLVICIFIPFSKFIKEKFKPNYKFLFITIILFISSVAIIMNPNMESPFIYFNF